MQTATQDIGGNVDNTAGFEVWITVLNGCLEVAKCCTKGEKDRINNNNNRQAGTALGSQPRLDLVRFDLGSARRHCDSVKVKI